MTKQEFKYFLDDPVKFLNNPHIYTKIKHNHGSLKLNINIGYCNRDDLNPVGYYPGNRSVPSYLYPARFDYSRKSITAGIYRPESINFIIQESESMVIPVSIGYAPLNDPDPLKSDERDDKSLQWSLKISTTDRGKKISTSKGKISYKTIVVPAYYLQWGKDRVCLIKLGKKARLFFTAQLSGCSILVFETADGLIIMHYNRYSWWQSHNDDARLVYDVESVKESILQRYNIQKYRVINTDDYDAEKTGGIFGVYSKGHWNLYFNRFSDQVKRADGTILTGRYTQRVRLQNVP